MKWECSGWSESGFGRVGVVWVECECSEWSGSYLCGVGVVLVEWK